MMEASKMLVRVIEKKNHTGEANGFVRMEFKSGENLLQSEESKMNCQFL